RWWRWRVKKPAAERVQPRALRQPLLDERAVTPWINYEAPVTRTSRVTARRSHQSLARDGDRGEHAPACSACRQPHDSSAADGTAQGWEWASESAWAPAQAPHPVHRPV